MARYSGLIGFASIPTESSPGIFKPEIVERTMKGSVLEFTSRLGSGDKINDDVTITNQLSLIGDAYSFENVTNIRYAWFFGQKVKVESVRVAYPRLELNLGGEWNE